MRNDSMRWQSRRSKRQHSQGSKDSCPLFEADQFLPDLEEEEERGGLELANDFFPTQMVFKFDNDLFSEISFSQGLVHSQSELTSLEFAPAVENPELNIHDEKLFVDDNDSAMARSAPDRESRSRERSIQDELF